MEDLLEVIGQDASEIPGYCNTDLRGPGPHYWDWEYIARERLEKLGYYFVCWVDGERDSFGPLTRIAVVVKDRKMLRLIYG
jgi:hypothetical protein